MNDRNELNDRNQQMLTVRQLAQRWALHPMSIRRMITARKLVCYRLQSATGNSAMIRIRMADIIDYEENK